MATLKLLIRNKSENSNIYVYYSLGQKIRLYRKTGYVVNYKDWNPEKEQIKIRDKEAKELNIKLSELKIHLEKAYNNAISEGVLFSGEWLQNQIDIFNNKIPIVELDVLTNYIQKYIDEAPYKQNQKKELGLSNGRVQNLKLFKSTIKRYETEMFKSKSILIKNINIQFVEKYKIWLFSKGYSINYVGKNIANIRTICLDASKNNIAVSDQVNKFKGVSESKNPEDIVFLSEEEQEQIKNTVLFREALINARKWLLLGCLIGQRGGDLLSITQKNIKDLGGIKIIELKQQKTGKLVAIPLLPEALEIIKNGLPYKISIVKFNEYIKEVCKEANLIAPTKGRKKPVADKVKKSEKTTIEINKKPKKVLKPTIKGVFQKWEVISSHVCRRSFASNFYGRIPTPVLMNITAHGTERMFLIYIGKTSYDNAYQMLDYFSKLAPKPKTPVLDIIRNTGEQQ
nr:phage integrase SAM-like domain-containing protein [uncultured Flavobacterium sp.]